MLTTLETQFPAFQQLLSGFAYMAGMALILKGVYQLRLYGDLRTMMPGHTNLVGPLVSLAVGAVFLFLPTAYRVTLITIFGTPTVTPLSYSTTAGNEWYELEKVVVGVINLAGLLAFIRGFFILAKAGDRGNPNVSFGKGLTHIIGGIMAMNIIGMKNILYTSLGLN